MKWFRTTPCTYGYSCADCVTQRASPSCDLGLYSTYTNTCARPRTTVLLSVPCVHCSAAGHQLRLNLRSCGCTHGGLALGPKRANNHSLASCPCGSCCGRASCRLPARENRSSTSALAHSRGRSCRGFARALGGRVGAHAPAWLRTLHVSCGLGGNEALSVPIGRAKRARCRRGCPCSPSRWTSIVWLCMPNP